MYPPSLEPPSHYQWGLNPWRLFAEVFPGLGLGTTCVCHADLSFCYAVEFTPLCTKTFCSDVNWTMMPSWFESCYFSKVILFCVGLKVTLRGRWLWVLEHTGWLPNSACSVAHESPVPVKNRGDDYGWSPNNKVEKLSENVDDQKTSIRDKGIQQKILGLFSRALVGPKGTESYTSHSPFD